MSARTSIVEFFGLVRSAVAVSAAAEARRPAPRRHLERLGINPDQFDRVGR